MHKIGIIDDITDVRVSMIRDMAFTLEELEKDDTWSIIGSKPFSDKDDYLHWINENDVAIMIIDEKLHEGLSDGESVNYNGSDLIDFLRLHLKDFPIYVVSSYSDDISLKEKLSLFDDIVSREEYRQESTKYVGRFLRAGERFLNTYADALSELTELSKKIAIGDYTEADVKRASAIQQRIEIPLTIEEVKTRREWLKEYEKSVADYKNLQKEITNYLDKSKNEVETDQKK